jgi:predicted esterase
MSLNVVCFHGFNQNPTILKEKLEKLTRSIKNVNWYYPEGGVGLPDNRYAYWIYNKDDPLTVDWNDLYSKEKVVYGIEDSLENLKDLEKTIGRIDGLVGFSQGGCMVDYLCSNKVLEPKFAIFISAFSYANNVNNIPSLHFYGINDTVISPKRSALLADYYPNHLKYIHDKTHIIPSNSEAKKILREFMAQFHC